ncbi:MAG: hypothetical protein ABSE49_23100 [Polyangiaceae bacterium]|jgi:hypothetical protein
MASLKSLPSWRWGLFALVFGAAASCSKAQPTASAQTRPPPQRLSMAEVPPPADGQHGEGRKGGNFRESVVYVDGQAKGILRFSELPPTLKPILEPEIDDLGIPRYYHLVDYLQAIGVDVDHIREMHVSGSHDRIAVFTGEELRSHRDRMVFDFTQQVAGKPRARWAQLHAIPHKPMVDVILNVSIYIAKTPPTFAHGDIWLDGKVVDEPIPYVGDGVPKGTRVYSDGKLDGWVRRKTLPNKLIAPDSEVTNAKFSTDAFLAYVGADTRNAKTIDFYANDALVARVDGKTWSQTKGQYEFVLPSRSHGQVEQLFPGDLQGRVTSIKVYVHATAPERKLQPAALAPQGGSDDPQNVGGGDGSGGGNGGGNGGNTGVTTVAHGVNNGSAADDDTF